MIFEAWGYLNHEEFTLVALVHWVDRKFNVRVSMCRILGLAIARFNCADLYLGDIANDLCSISFFEQRWMFARRHQYVKRDLRVDLSIGWRPVAILLEIQRLCICSLRISFCTAGVKRRLCKSTATRQRKMRRYLILRSVRSRTASCRPTLVQRLRSDQGSSSVPSPSVRLWQGLNTIETSSIVAHKSLQRSERIVLLKELG